ncbi:MAG: hypothetical protein Q9M26_04690 [Mariprofundales bacterium]|nr:hypothetical protein [Mariprofundales bacterium]
MWARHVAMLLLVYLLLRASLPLSAGSELDADEGLHLMMAWLFHQGYPFFSEIRYDHFPLFDVMLAGWLELFGFAPQVGREMVVLLAALLAWLLYLLVQVRYGVLPSIIALFLLFFSEGFLISAGTLLQALPWMTFGIASLVVLRLGRGDDACARNILLSAMLMAIAIQIKLFAVLLLPAMAGEFLFCPRMGGWREGAKRLLHWSVALALLSVLLLVITAPELFDPSLLRETYHYLVVSHLGLDDLRPTMTLWALLQHHIRDFPLLLLAMVGVVLTLRHGARMEWFPVVWLISDAVALGLIHPVWYHYYTMISIPVVWLAAGAVAELVPDASYRDAAVDRWFRQGVGILLWLLIAITPLRAGDISHALHAHQNPLDDRLVGTLKSLAPTTHWVVTDRPIYPYLAQMNVVPELAVTSLSLMHSGAQSAQSYVQAIDRYHPEVVLLNRFRQLRLALREPLRQRGYVLMYGSRGALLFVRAGTTAKVVSTDAG